MSFNSFDRSDFDREERNESDGQMFYGIDNDNGTTDWYTEDGTLDCCTETPED